MTGEVSASALRARLQRGEEACGVVEEGAQRRQVGVDRVQGRRALFDRFLDVGAGDAGEGGEGAVEGDEEAGLGLGDRGDRRREVLERPPEAGEVGARCDDRPQHRLAVDDQPAQGADRFVQLRAAAGEGVAEAGQVLADRLPGRLVEHVEELVDVDRFGRGGGERDRFAGVEALARSCRG